MVSKKKTQPLIASDTDTFLLLASALRYALPRHTYICPTIADIIEQNTHLLSDSQIEMIIKDIKNDMQFFGEQMHKCDKQTWVRLVQRLEYEQKQEKDRNL